MRFNGSLNDTLNGLGAASVVSAYNKEKAKVAELWAYSVPTSTGTRPDDSLIFSDPYGYLRTVLNNSDWDGVTRWYATRINEILKNSTRPPDFWDISKLNLQNYCDRTLNLRDLRAFTEKCILVMCVADYGNKVGFGYAGKRDDLNLAMFFANGLSHNDGQLNWFQSFDAAKSGSRYGFCIGWVKEPAKHTASKIMVAIGAAIIGGAAFTAFSAPTSAATGVASGSASGAAAGTASGAAASAVIPAGIETVTVVASAAPAITAGSVAAGLSAGAVAIAAAPPPLTTPPIETVTVVGSAPAAGVTVGEALTAGAVATAASAPALLTPSIETVTVEAPRVEQQPVSAAETAATGLVSVGIQYPTINAGNPPNPEYAEDSLTDRIKENLQDAAEQYGQQWIEDHLAQWLRDQLGREPTPVEYEQYEDYISPYSPASLFRKLLPIVLGALVVAAFLNRAGN